MAFDWTPTTDELTTIELSIKVALCCASVSVVPGVAVGWLLARKDFWGKTAFDGLVHLPLVMPPVVVGYVLLLLLGRNRPLGGWLHDALGVEVAFTWWAAVLASAVMGFPLLVRAVRLSIELVDRRLERAAATLGAPPIRVLFTITLPLAFPGIVTGVMLAFARSLGEFGATIIFAGNIPGETQTLPLAVYSYAQRQGGEAPALKLVVFSILISFAAVCASEFMMRRTRGRNGDDPSC